MATTQEKWQEIANRGLQDQFDPQTRAKFDEAVNRGLIQTPGVQQTQPAAEVQPQAQIPEPTQPESVTRQDLGVFERIGFGLREKLGSAQFANEVRARQGLPPVDVERTGKPTKEDMVAILKNEAERGAPEIFTPDELNQFKSDEAIPEFRLGDTGGVAETAKLAAALAVTSDPAEQASIAENLVPNSTVRQRFDDAWVLTFPDPETGENKEVLLNRPGASPIDAMNIFAEITKGIIASKGARVGGGLAARTAIAGGIGAAEQTAIETTQAQIGGTFDPLDIALEGVLNVGGELLPSLAKGVVNRLTKGGREKIKAAKTLNELLDANLTREDAEVIIKEWDSIKAAAEKQGIQVPTAEQVSSTFADRGFQLPVEKVLAAGRSSEAGGRVLEAQAAKGVQDVSKSAKGVTSSLSSATPDEALRGVQETAVDIIRDAKIYRSQTAKVAYDRVAKLAPKEGIDVSPIVGRIDKILEVTPNVSSIKNHLEATKEALETLKAPRKVTGSKLFGTQQITEGTSKLPFEMLQQINFLMRDLAKVQNDKSITSVVKTNARGIEQEITKALNKATRGEYSKVDAIYKKMSDDLSILQEGRIGRAADIKEDTIGNIMDVVFNPKPTNVSVSKRFMEDLTKADPQAAKDLYATYIDEQIDFLADGAKPSELLKAIFGRDRKGKNMILELAPTPEAKEAFATYERVLNALRTTEGAEAKVGAKAEVQAMFDQGGIRTMLAHFMRFTKSFERGAEAQASKKNAKAWIEAWTNEDLAKNLRRIKDLNLTPRETASQADSFLRKAWENANRRTLKEAAARSAGIEAVRENQE